MQLEYGVEYYPNTEEGEQFEYLTERDFLGLIASHKARGFDPAIEYDRFTIFENGRDGRLLTIRDVYGIFYG
jgi:hypothetical protein